MMSLPKSAEYFSSPSPKASKAPQISNTACHAVPRKRSSVLPECSYCPACFRNSTNALLTASQSPFSAAVKKCANPGAAALVDAFACASFSATNDFNWATTSGFLMDSQLVDFFLAQPPLNSRQ